MDRKPDQRLSKLEEDLQALMRQSDHDHQQSETIRLLLERMARQNDRKVIVTGYPACNSEK